jgi:hypothetical protein
MGLLFHSPEESIVPGACDACTCKVFDVEGVDIPVVPDAAAWADLFPI